MQITGARHAAVRRRDRQRQVAVDVGAARQRTTTATAIITIEDPIEFVHQHPNCITQREVGVTDFTGDWQIALKNTLRQAPDVIPQSARSASARRWTTRSHFPRPVTCASATLHANSAIRRSTASSTSPRGTQPSWWTCRSARARSPLPAAGPRHATAGRVPSVE
ncbi:MAG: Flp pilus assembly complex ATPase component TadA [Betaproteobacteria bacterium]|nr:Flp pilus assembly complex ATPase component TadA [Betaproteobacteria bacterium]